MREIIAEGIVEFVKHHSAAFHYACQIQIKNLTPTIEGNNRMGFYRGYPIELKQGDKVAIVRYTGWQSFFRGKYTFEEKQ
jgi:hypothetical protein